MEGEGQTFGGRFCSESPTAEDVKGARFSDTDHPSKSHIHARVQRCVFVRLLYGLTTSLSLWTNARGQVEGLSRSAGGVLKALFKLMR